MNAEVNCGSDYEADHSRLVGVYPTQVHIAQNATAIQVVAGLQFTGPSESPGSSRGKQENS